MCAACGVRACPAFRRAPRAVPARRAQAAGAPDGPALGPRDLCLECVRGQLRGLAEADSAEDLRAEALALLEEVGAGVGMGFLCERVKGEGRRAGRGAEDLRAEAPALLEEVGAWVACVLCVRVKGEGSAQELAGPGAARRTCGPRR